MNYFQLMKSDVINMRVVVFFALTLAVITLSCDPPLNSLSAGTFSIKAKVSNPNDTIHLGDSIYFDFEIPDTINLGGSAVALTSKDGCDLTTTLSQADSTLTGGLRMSTNGVKLYGNPGIISNGGIRFYQSGGRCWGRLYLIPQSPGVYILFCQAPGYFTGNSDELEARVVYDFDVADKHHNLLKKAAGQQNNIDVWIQSEESKGQGVYAFAVK
jgi:hypothetical protein